MAPAQVLTRPFGELAGLGWEQMTLFYVAEAGGVGEEWSGVGSEVEVQACLAERLAEDKC